MSAYYRHPSHTLGIIWKAAPMIAAAMFLPSTGHSANCDPVVEGADISFPNNTCWYQVQDVSASNWHFCQGQGGGGISCGNLVMGNSYRVKKVDTSNGWDAITPNFEFVAQAAVVSGNSSCQNPVINGSDISFSDQNCFYQLKDVTAQDWNLCQGWGHEIESMNECPALVNGHKYEVARVLSPWTTIDDLEFTAVIDSQEQAQGGTDSFDQDALRHTDERFNYYAALPLSQLNYRDNLMLYLPINCERFLTQN